jgi:hypothetical protein
LFIGHGCLTDLDRQRNYFGPGDTVILPKGWSGRWDVLEDTHKNWFVNDHCNIEETNSPIRAIVTHYKDLSTAAFRSDDARSQIIYDVGPTKVGSQTPPPEQCILLNRKRVNAFPS